MQKIYNKNHKHIKILNEKAKRKNIFNKIAKFLKNNNYNILKTKMTNIHEQMSKF